MADTQYLALVALSPNDALIISELTRIIAANQCQIINSHTAQQGNCYTINLLLSGNWSAVAKAEAALQSLAQKHSFQIFLQRTEIKPPEKPALPYVIYLVTKEEPEILHQIIKFFQQDRALLYEVYTDSYTARFTQTPMLSMTLRLHFPADLSIAEWRERFMLFCDDLNLDAMMEPEKS